MTATLALLGVKGGPAIRPGSHMPTCSLLRLAGQTILIDAGLGVSRAICDQGVALTGIDMIFVTHLHSDHYLELGPLLHTAWTAGLTRPIPIIGPSGLSAYWERFCQSMAFDIDLRIRDEGRCDFAGLARISVLGEGSVDHGGITVVAMRNVHPPITDSYALKFAADGKVIVLSGDTAYMPEMADFARDADLLVHEAMLRDGVEALCARMTNGDARLRQHIFSSHTDASDVGRIASDAGVRRLAVHHFVPDGDPDFPDSAWEDAIRKHWQGPLYLGKDGVVIELE